MRENKFSYGVRHAYGLEGQRVVYSPTGCKKMIEGDPTGKGAEGGCHDCPFVYAADVAGLLKNAYGLADGDVAAILAEAGPRRPVPRDVPGRPRRRCVRRRIVGTAAPQGAGRRVGEGGRRPRAGARGVAAQGVRVPDELTDRSLAVTSPTMRRSLRRRGCPRLRGSARRSA